MRESLGISSSEQIFKRDFKKKWWTNDDFSPKGSRLSEEGGRAKWSFANKIPKISSIRSIARELHFCLSIVANLSSKPFHLAPSSEKDLAIIGAEGKVKRPSALPLEPSIEPSDCRRGGKVQKPKTLMFGEEGRREPEVVSLVRVVGEDSLWWCSQP